MTTTQELLRRANDAKGAMAMAGSDAKNGALVTMAMLLDRYAPTVLTANATDVEEARGTMSDVMLDRLILTPERVRHSGQRPVFGLGIRQGHRPFGAPGAQQQFLCGHLSPLLPMKRVPV